MWQEYLDHEQNTPGKLEYYIAQLTAMVVQPNLPKGKSVSLKDFLNPVKFVRKKLQAVNEKQNINATKAFFFGGVGIIGRGKK